MSGPAVPTPIPGHRDRESLLNACNSADGELHAIASSFDFLLCVSPTNTREAMMEFAKDHLRPSAQYHAWGNTEFIRNNLIEERYLAEQQYGVGKMYNLHVRLKVDPEDVARFNALAHQWEVQQAVEETSIGGLLVLGSLVVAYVGLRYFGCKKRTNQIDTAAPAPPDAAA